VRGRIEEEERKFTAGNKKKRKVYTSLFIRTYGAILTQWGLERNIHQEKKGGLKSVAIGHLGARWGRSPTDISVGWKATRTGSRRKENGRYPPSANPSKGKNWEKKKKPKKKERATEGRGNPKGGRITENARNRIPKKKESLENVIG